VCVCEYVCVCAGYILSTHFVFGTRPALASYPGSPSLVPRLFIPKFPHTLRENESGYEAKTLQSILGMSVLVTDN